MAVILALVIYIEFGRIGIWLMRESFANIKTGIQSQKWIVIHAIVNNYQINSHVGEYGQTKYRCVILCHYKISDFLYKTHEYPGYHLYPRPYGCLSLEGFSTLKDAEIAALKFYPIGKSVKLFCNPKAHTQIIFSSDWSQGSFLTFVLGFGFLLVAILTLVISILSLFGISGEVINRIVTPIALILCTVILATTLCTFVWIIGVVIAYKLKPRNK